MMTLLSAEVFTGNIAIDAGGITVHNIFIVQQARLPLIHIRSRAGRLP